MSKASEVLELVRQIAEKKYGSGELWISDKTNETRLITGEDSPVSGYRMIVFTYVRKGTSDTDAVTVDAFTAWVKRTKARQVTDPSEKKELSKLVKKGSR